MSTEPAAESALEAGNVVFHEAYAQTREGVSHDVPVLVVLSTELALHCRGARRAYSVALPSFAAAKSTAHIAVALFTLSCDGCTADKDRTRLAALLQHTRNAVEALSSDSGDSLARENQALLNVCAEFGTRVAREHTVPEPALAEFARDAGARVLHITELATREQIATLHGAVEQALASLSPGERASLQVVVLGDHQARARSLSMQYFQQRFAEAPGADERVTYGENISNEAEAVALVGTRKLDRRIARAFFGDEKRLQRDVLGDATQRCLEGQRFPRI